MIPDNRSIDAINMEELDNISGGLGRDTEFYLGLDDIFETVFDWLF